MHSGARQDGFIISSFEAVHNGGPASSQQNLYNGSLLRPHNSHGIITNISTSHGRAQSVSPEIKTNFLNNRNWAGYLECGLTETEDVADSAHTGTFPLIELAGDVGQIPVLHGAVEAHVDILKVREDSVRADPLRVMVSLYYVTDLIKESVHMLQAVDTEA